MARQLIGTNYADMDEKYRSRVSEEIYNDRKSDQRFAADAIAAGGLEKFKNDAFNVNSLDEFNFGAVGAGGAAGKGSKNLANDDQSDNVYGRGRERFSKFDAKGLMATGKFTAQELWDHGVANDGKDDFIFGKRTQRYLKGLMDDGGNPPPAKPLPVDPPVNQGDGSIYKGGNYQYFNDIGGDITDSFNKNSGIINVNNGVNNAVINDNSRIYGGDSSNYTYNGGGDMLADPFDDDPQSPTPYNNTPGSQGFLDSWKEHFMARNRFGG